MQLFRNLHPKMPIVTAFRFLLLAGLVLAPNHAWSTDKLSRNCEETNLSGECQLFGPSLIEIIANPERYDGKKIRIIGFMHLEFEGNGIYLNKSDYLNRISKNGLWLSISGDLEKRGLKLNDSYVIVEGVFDANHFGHLRLWSGTIKDVTRLDAWRSLKNETKS